MWGGWRAQKFAILAVLEEQRPPILLLQEARVAHDHRRGFEHFFRRAGYKAIFGVCPTWVRNKRGTQRIDQTIPGVVCLYRESETVTRQALLTPAAKENYHNEWRFFRNSIGDMRRPTNPLPALRDLDSTPRLLRGLFRLSSSHRLLMAYRFDRQLLMR